MKSNTLINPELDGQVAAVRRFSRFYTRKLGIIEPKLLDSPWTLQEARIIYEIAATADLHRDRSGPRARSRCRLSQPHAANPAAAPDRRAKAVEDRPPRRRTRIDRERPHGLCRTRPPLAHEVAGLLGKLDPAGRAAAVAAMTTIEQTLEPPAQQPAGFLLRSHRPGDIGWIVSRHGALYARGIWLGHQFRGARRRDRGAVHPVLRCFARTLLDRGDRRRTGRLGVSGQGFRRRRKIAPAAGGAKGARARRRTRADRAVHPLCAGRPATRRSRCGPRASWSPRAESTSGRDFGASRKRSTTALAPIWSARPGRLKL